MTYDKGPFKEIKCYWVHARPYTRQVVKRFAIGFGYEVAIHGIAYPLHFYHWITVLISLPGLIYLSGATLLFFADDIEWQQKEEERNLEEQLESPDLHQRFTALRVRLHGNDAKELEQLQKVMEFGVREAERLAEEIRKYEGISSAMRDQQGRDRESAEALAKLLDSQVERVANIIERKGRLGQWVLLILGAILGVVVQALAQWIF